MNKEAQRIAIAEACGWKWIDHPDTLAATKSFTLPGKWVINPLRKLDSPHYAPDYLNSLDAMHEAEKWLTPEQQLEYSKNLHRLIAKIDIPNFDDAIETWTWHATASQRAEAFLRTIGKWEDDK